MTRARSIAIFGATSKIAEASARRWAAEGASLFLAGRRADALERIARDLEVRGAPRVSVWSGDLARTDQHQAALEALGEAMPKLDVALLAWGTLTDQPRAEADVDYAAQELMGNFVAPAALLLPLAERLADTGGVLACISSVAGDRGRGSNFVYGSAKAGLQSFLEGLRHRYYARGVAVLDVRPGFVRTPMTDHVESRGPLWATPDKVAADIVRAVERRAAVLYTPWFWRWIMLVVRSLPRPLFHRSRL